MSVPSFVRGTPEGVSATDHIRRFVLSMAMALQEMPHDDSTRKHDHVVALRATMHTLGMAVAEILEHPETEHEERLNSLLARISGKLEENGVPSEYDLETSSVRDVVAIVTHRTLLDLRAIVDQIDLDKMGLSLDGFDEPNEEM